MNNKFVNPTNTADFSIRHHIRCLIIHLVLLYKATYVHPSFKERKNLGLSVKLKRCLKSRHRVAVLAGSVGKAVLLPLMP